MKAFDRAVQVAEVIGAIAVVISLIYVGSEIRQNTFAVQDSSHQSTLGLSHEIERMLYDPDFAAIYDAGLRDYSSLTDIQRRQFYGFVTQRLNVFEYVFYGYYSRESIDEEVWSGYDTWIRSEFRNDSWVEVWRDARGFYGQQFATYIDAFLEDE